MTAKLEETEEKPKNLDSLRFPEVKNLLERICKILGFRFIYYNICSRPTWFLEVDNNDDTVVFLEGCNRDEFQTAKDLLRGILNARIFKIRHVGSFEERTIQNPFYRLSLPALQIKLDLLA